MQSGFARTGKKFGYEHYEVQADLLCCGKGIASGFPLSAVIGTAEIMDLPEVGNMSSTHSGNPIVCVAGLATLNEIQRLDLINEVQRNKVKIWEVENKHKVAIELKTNNINELPKLVSQALSNHTYNNLIKFREESLFNYGFAGETAAKQLKHILNKI